MKQNEHLKYYWQHAAATSLNNSSSSSHRGSFSSPWYYEPTANEPFTNTTSSSNYLCNKGMSTNIPSSTDASSTLTMMHPQQFSFCHQQSQPSIDFESHLPPTTGRFLLPPPK
jgi:hypothetical protein